MKLLKIILKTLFFALTLGIAPIAAMQENKTPKIKFVTKLWEDDCSNNLYQTEAYDKNCQIGYAYFDISNRDNAKLDWIMLDPNYRHLGLGSQFFNKVMKTMKKQGCTQSTWKAIPLDSSKSVTDLIAFYQKNGAVLLEDPTQVEHPWMKKDLTK